MKKPLLDLISIFRMQRQLSLLLSLLLVPLGVLGQTITVAGISPDQSGTVTGTNISGTVSFNSQSNTLTLTDATITGNIVWGNSGQEDLTILMSGKNSVIGDIKAETPCSLHIEKITDAESATLKYTGSIDNFDLETNFKTFSIEDGSTTYNYCTTADVYFLWVGDIQVHNIEGELGYKGNILKDNETPTVTFDGTNKITLNGATLTNSIMWAIEADLTIELKGKNSITTDGKSCIFSEFKKALSFTAGGDNCSLELSTGTSTETPVFYNITNVTYGGLLYKSENNKISITSPTDITKAEISLSESTFTYDRTEKKPTVTSVKLNNEELDATYYTVSYSNNTNAGNATVTVTGSNIYKNAATKTFTINPKSIANVTITLSPESFTFNGENQKPTTVTVKDGETNLVLDTDYTLTNEGGTDAGKYTVTVTGKGNYSGTASKEYSITAGTMEVTAEGYTGTYDGKAYGITVKAPEGATIKYGTAEGTYDLTTSATIKYGTAEGTYDLTTSPTYTNAGTYTVYYSVSKTNYADVTGSKNVVINAKSIANVTITLSPESFTFNGENQKPTTVTVKDGETNLVLDTDYTLTNEGGTDAGEYTVTATGKAEGYTGTYDGQAHGITVTAPKGATIKYGTAEGTYDLTTNPSYTNVGTYTVYYQVSMENYADVTGSKNVVINKATVTLSFSASTAEGKMGEAFTAPTLNNPSQVAIAYSSSNTEVATIGTDGVVTLTGAGKTTITATFAGNDNYASATASYELTVGKQQEAGLSWTDEGMEYYIGDYWYGPRLNNPNKLKVKYESSDEDVATIDENGVVTVLGVGDTWIMAIFEGSDEYEPQTVRYGLFVKERYNLWVDGTQVTSDNRRDILGDGQFFYDEDKKMLVVTNSTKAVDIENRKGDLTIFLNGSSKLGRIFFNKGETDNSGKLTITTYENIPGATTLETSDANGVISGFSSLTIDEDSYTFLLDPTKGQYQGGKLVTAEGAVAQTAIIGQYIEPLVNGQTVTFPPGDFDVTFPPGDFDIENLTNAVIKDLLMTLLMDLGTSQVETDDDYYDASENCIVLNNLNSTNGVSVVVDNVQKGQYIPGSSDFAAAFKGGITFMVPNGEGKIILNVQTEPGYKLMLMIDNGIPTEIVKNERGDVEVDYNVEKPTYCYIYLDQTAGTRGTRIGKREKSHGKVFSLKVSPAKSLSTNPLGGVPGFPDSQTPEVDTFGEDDPTGINEVKVETDNTLESNDDNWYDLQGRRIDKPTKAGIYIQNRKKIVIR